jgi:hypothetical protein
LVFINVVESVYSAVRADSLYQADGVWSLKFKSTASHLFSDLQLCKKTGGYGNKRQNLL